MLPQGPTRWSDTHTRPIRRQHPPSEPTKAEQRVAGIREKVTAMDTEIDNLPDDQNPMDTIIDKLRNTNDERRERRYLRCNGHQPKTDQQCSTRLAYQGRVN